MQQPAGLLGALIQNLAATIADPAVWWSLLVAVLVGGCLLVVGRLVARRLGLLAPDASEAEVLGIGLSVGLVIAAVSVATIASAGRSAFTPILVALVAAVALTFVRTGAPSPATRGLNRLPVGPVTALAAVSMLVGIGLLFGATMAPSPRDGLQPVEFMDEAFYSILGRDLVATGTEAFYSPSGLAPAPGLPEQNWYHWAELWLGGAAALVPGVGASFGRHLVVLPLLLVAIAALIGSMARRAVGSPSRQVLVFGAAAGLLLAPLPVPGTGNYFTTWASGLLFSVTMYGLAAVEVALLMLLVLVARGRGEVAPATILAAGALAAVLLPSHVALALLALAGALVAVSLLAIQLRVELERIPRPPRAAVLVAAAIVGLAVLVVAWGTATGHRILGSGSTVLVTPFNGVWIGAILAAVAGAAAMLTIPVAWLLVRRRGHAMAALLVAVMAIVAGGAVGWGLRMAEFTMFHVFFGAIAVFGTPVAAASIVLVWRHLRDRGHRRAAMLLVVVAILQVEAGILSAGVRLVQFSPRDYPPVPIAILDAIRSLEPEAKLAYACDQREEIAYWDARLLSIDMHTGRRIVPLCFEADFLAPYIGSTGPAGAVSPQFATAPQFDLFPTASARPTPEEVMAFMEQHGIGYLYVDAVHPNTLVPGAVPVLVVGETQVLRLP